LSRTGFARAERRGLLALAISPWSNPGETVGDVVPRAVFFGIVLSPLPLQVPLHVMRALGPREADQGSI